MNILSGVAWGFITARGGSKSIPLKNIVLVNDKPLLCYCIDAAAKAKSLDRIICSTDHEKIAEVALARGVEILERPEHLCGDLVASLDVVLDGVSTLARKYGSLPEIVVLIQPTSIFLKAEHIDTCVESLLNTPKAGSSQAVIKVPHQFHAHNQRIMAEEGCDIWFAFPKEREAGHNKQTKPTFYTYGNLIVTRTKSLLNDKTLFASPSIPIVIPSQYAYDLDGPGDIALAELMIEKNIVILD